MSRQRLSVPSYNTLKGALGTLTRLSVSHIDLDQNTKRNKEKEKGT